MNKFKLPLLASAMSLVSVSANAELKALDDTVLSDMTGQAGITIELETAIDIGSVTYTDTDGHPNDVTPGAGSRTVSGIKIGGADFTTGKVAGLLDDIKIEIDLAADGDAVISINSVSGGTIDFGYHADSVTLSGTAGTDTLTTFSNIDLIGKLWEADLRVDTATDTLVAELGFTIENLDFDMPYLSVGVRGLTVTSDGSAGITPTEFASQGAVYAKLTLGGVDRNSDGINDVLNITVAPLEADINIAAIEIGGTSIGSLAINDLVLSNTVLNVYGH